ncbi:SsrA-binding protein SmpB [Roseimaritima ulvae]|uniref:SsrA-binding protein n=1 Tax=Roseimaritima ulvae TaxID=980254 RepID=A0A5B9QXB6_9BACT|nr:SsrA-binding protein SmpB [Roseimaritima ulvae]QEG43658.1 SsrA-binding protein [Roseimaritima ulvae]
MPKKNKSKKSKKSEKSKKGNKAKEPTTTIVSENRKARHRYEIIDSLECGMMLMGSEVKAMRDGKLSLDEAYIRFQKDELWLIGADISHYANAGMWNHDPRRPRKLLVHKRELDAFGLKAKERGLTLIPLRVYFNARGIAKCVMGLVKGKQLHDKRQAIKDRDTQRGLQRAMRGRK